MYELSQQQQESLIEIYEDWKKTRGERSFDEFIYWISELASE